MYTSLDELTRSHASVQARLSHHLAVVARHALSRPVCDDHARRVVDNRNLWVSDFDGEQFTLGRAWYTHLEQGKASEYFSHAARANQDVREVCPGLVEWIVESASTLLCAPIRQRERWCGPGVHIFLPGSDVARLGGVVHYDWEGLSAGQRQERTAALSLVLMLAPSESGGGTRIWDMRYPTPEGSPLDGVAMDVAHYEAGDLLIMDSYALHQIEPFEGAAPRISATAHLAETRMGWEMWF
jgi:hypothetical protein